MSGPINESPRHLERLADAEDARLAPNPSEDDLEGLEEVSLEDALGSLSQTYLGSEPSVSKSTPPNSPEISQVSDSDSEIPAASTLSVGDTPPKTVDPRTSAKINTAIANTNAKEMAVRSNEKLVGLYKYSAILPLLDIVLSIMTATIGTLAACFVAAYKAARFGSEDAKKVFTEDLVKGFMPIGQAIGKKTDRVAEEYDDLWTNAKQNGARSNPITKELENPYDIKGGKGPKGTT